MNTFRVHGIHNCIENAGIFITREKLLKPIQDAPDQDNSNLSAVLVMYIYELILDMMGLEYNELL